MPSRRMIDPSLAESETLARLPFQVRYLFILIFSQADDQGRMKAHPSLVRAKLLPYDDVPLADVQAWLGRLAEGDFIQLYDEDETAILQVVNWWKYQRPSWAWPSLLPPPPGWQDRVCYRQGNNVVKSNWDHGEPAPGNPPSADDPTVTPPRPHDEPAVTPAPSGRDSGSGNVSTSGRDSGSNLPAAAAAPTSPPAAASKPRRQAKPKEPKEPLHPAIIAFHEGTGKYPDKATYIDIETAVGRDPADCERFQEVCHAYVGCGWNPRNVIGMLNFYKDGKMPGEDLGQARASPKGGDNGNGNEPKSWKHIREWDRMRAEQEGG